jgi:hypothetical protein
VSVSPRSSCRRAPSSIRSILNAGTSSATSPCASPSMMSSTRSSLRSWSGRPTAPCVCHLGSFRRGCGERLEVPLGGPQLPLLLSSMRDLWRWSTLSAKWATPTPSVTHPATLTSREATGQECGCVGSEVLSRWRPGNDECHRAEDGRMASLLEEDW